MPNQGIEERPARRSLVVVEGQVHGLIARSTYGRGAGFYNEYAKSARHPTRTVRSPILERHAIVISRR